MTFSECVKEEIRIKVTVHVKGLLSFLLAAMAEPPTMLYNEYIHSTNVSGLEVTVVQFMGGYNELCQI